MRRIAKRYELPMLDGIKNKMKSLEITVHFKN